MYDDTLRCPPSVIHCVTAYMCEYVREKMCGESHLYKNHIYY